MALVAGAKVGCYEVLGPVGAGGMGQVYRARDTRLNRNVAIKVLPEEFSSSADRRQRFEREAQAISALNHAHICTIHDIGRHDGIDYIVMELVEGESLADRLERGPLSPEQVIRLGSQLADALDNAHRHGVIHRDVKPGNIMLTKNGAKLLDFGLAKTVSGSAPVHSEQTVSKPLTAEGTIVGTVQYMSPEQVEGKDVDARSDIFSLGSVLYEMVTGRRAFPGKSQISVASAILEKEPEPMGTLKPLTPLALDHAVRVCLAKDPADRWQNARDLLLELSWIIEADSRAGELGRATRRQSTWYGPIGILTAALAIAVLAALAGWWKKGNESAAPTYFNAAIPFAANDLALSPDGQTLALVAYSSPANDYVLWTHEIGSRRTIAIEGARGASYPFWSPDGKSIGFFSDGKLKKLDLPGGQIQVLCDAPNGRGGTWNRDGVIIFAPDSLGSLFRVSSWGGAPVEIAQPDTSRSESSLRWPVFLPDGNHYFFLTANFTGEFEKNALMISALDSKERRLLVRTSANATYVEPGYLLYLRDKTLVAQIFDPRQYVLRGEPHPMSDEVLYFSQVDRAVFGAAANNILVWQTGKGASNSRLTWFDRSGKPIGTVGPPAWFNNVRLSPDERSVAVDQTDPDRLNTDLWVYELARKAMTRLTFDPALDQVPIWASDSRKILFSSNRSSYFRLYLKSADGSGPEEEALRLPGTSPLIAWDWSRDGKHVLVRKLNELWSFSWPEKVGDHLFQAKWTVRNAQFSPDGRWIAYASNESGSMEIYVSPFPAGSGKWQVSSAGGQEPIWRKDGNELFYVSAEGMMMAVPVTTGASFKASSPVALFQTRRRQPISSQAVFSYDVSKDGRRFLIDTKMDEANAAPLAVLQNWTSALEK